MNLRAALAGVVAAVLLHAAAPPAQAAGPAIEPAEALVLADDTQAMPTDTDPRWTAVRLPDSRDHPVAWYRIAFDHAGNTAGDGWMVYLPYLYGGGRLWLNGEPVAAVQENGGRLRVRWERPLLLPLPLHALKPGRNVLHIRAVASHAPSSVKLPQLVLGPQSALQPMFDVRLFIVRTVPLVTVLTGAVAGLFVIFIWLRRRQEVLYGLFGLAALLWALRTTTFVFDAMPVELWPWWRMLYHASTGGFIIVLALFSQALAGLYRPRVALALGLYGLLGPLLYVLSGDAADEVVGRWWVLGLVPIGLSVAVLTFQAAWRQRSLGAVAIALAVAAAAAAGIHDYAVAWSAPWLAALAPHWAGHRIFLLHHGANIMLVVMGALLTARFVRSLLAVEEANRTLEARVAERERELAAGYARIAELQREQATQDERQRIVQELHDGLGSQLITSLLRAERGALDGPAAVEALRAAIDEMRVAIEALASDDHDFDAAFGNFRFRWDARLREAGVQAQWALDPAGTGLRLPPHDTLQILRVLQEALTNVLRHAGARRVDVSLQRQPDGLALAVRDDGQAAPAEPARGRGLTHMQARAQRIGATLTVALGTAPGGGSEVRLVVPLPGHRPGMPPLVEAVASALPPASSPAAVSPAPLPSSR